MIVVRDVFRLKFGKARDVKTLMQESRNLMDTEEVKNMRVLFDLVGHSYTMVLEMSHASLAAFEASMSKTMGKDEWREWYQKFTPLIDSSYREIFTVME